MTPCLEVIAVDGPYSWTWRLSDETGRTLAEQTVQIDSDDPSLPIAKDLYRNLWRIDTDPRQRFLARVGDFVGQRVLGDVGRAMSERAPVTVRVSVPRTAMYLLALPFEVAPLDGVTFCYDPGGAPPPTAHTGTPRVLAIFSLPAESSALALARERRALDAQFATFGESIELRTLQYGATRRAVANAIADEAGWDIIHVAGHGRAGQLLLENDDDTRDRVTAAEFVDLLARAPRPPGLVVLSTCESGAARVLRRRREPLGRVPRDLLELARGGTPGGGAENLAYEVAFRIGCAVLAMRYPVDDDFSIALSQRLYAGLLVDGLPIDEVLRSAIPAAAPRGAPLSAATPMLFGDPSFRLTPGRPTASVPPEPPQNATAPSPPDLFVGRTTVLTRLLQPRTVTTVLVGMPGVGKTACMAEAATLHLRQGREVVWHEVRPDETAEELHAALGDAVRDRDVLVALDSVDAAPHLGDVFAALTAPGARARFIMTSRRRIQQLRSADHVVVPLLSRTESELLDRQLDEKRWADTGRRASATSHARSWLISRGHPALIHHTVTGNEEARAWEVFTPVPSGRPTLPPDHPGAAIQAWAVDQSTKLPAAPRLLWQFLSSLEVADRREALVSKLWPLICAERGVPTQPLAATYAELTRHGMAQHWDRGRYLLHPAIARAGRDADSDTEGLVVGLLAAVWENRYEQWTQADDSEDALAHAAASSVPYLLRLGRWEHASTRCEEAINHDRAPDMAARLLPFLNEIVRSEPDLRRRRASRYVRATVLIDLNTGRAQEELEQIYTEAADDHDMRTQLAAATALAGLLIHRDPQEAAAWIQRASQGHDVDISAIPLVRLKLAKIAHQLGDNTLAREEATAVLEDLDRPGDHDDVRINRNSVRVEAMELAAAAAANLGDREQERTLREQIDHELARHGAGDRARAMAQFNQLANQVRSGGQLDNVADLLLAARSEFLNPADQAELALVLLALAKLEHRRRNHTEAVDLAYQALRSTYAAGEASSAATVHEDLAVLLTYLQPVPDDEVGVHLLAAAVIRLRKAGLMLALHPPPHLMRSLAMLSFRLARRPHDLPQSYNDLRDMLTSNAGVNLDDLLAGTERIPIQVDPDTSKPVLQSGSEAPGDTVRDALVWASNWPRPAELLDPQGHPEHWREVADLFANGTTTAERAEEVLDRLRAAGWQPLTDALATLSRGDKVSGDLDATDHTVLSMVRSSRTG